MAWRKNLFVGVAFFIAGTASAQPQSVLGPPPKVNLQPIDTNRAMSGATSGISNTLQPQRSRAPGTLSMSNFFPTISLASWPPKIPNVFPLRQKDNPYQPNPPKGTNPFPTTVNATRPGSVITMPGKLVTTPGAVNK